MGWGSAGSYRAYAIDLRSGFPLIGDWCRAVICAVEWVSSPIARCIPARSPAFRAASHRQQDQVALRGCQRFRVVAEWLLTSIPGDVEIRLKALPGSALPSELQNRGYIAEADRGDAAHPAARDRGRDDLDVIWRAHCRDRGFDPAGDHAHDACRVGDRCSIRSSDALTVPAVECLLSGEQRKTSARNEYFAF
jgi:hypothetical protein